MSVTQNRRNSIRYSKYFIIIIYVKCQGEVYCHMHYVFDEV